MHWEIFYQCIGGTWDIIGALGLSPLRWRISSFVWGIITGALRGVPKQ